MRWEWRDGEPSIAIPGGDLPSLLPVRISRSPGEMAAAARPCAFKDARFSLLVEISNPHRPIAAYGFWKKGDPARRALD
jgi:hypothetical protein